MRVCAPARRTHRWKVSVPACMSNVSMDRSYAVRERERNTSASDRKRPSRKMTMSELCSLSFFCGRHACARVSGQAPAAGGGWRARALMNRNRCFWFMHALWCTCVSTLRTL